MSVALLQPPVKALGFSVPGEVNQNLHRLIRRCSLAFTAIDGTEYSIVQLLLPTSLEWPSLFHGLLSISTRHQDRSLRDFEHYQIALSELRSEISTVQTQLADLGKTQKLLASSFLLQMFTRPWCDATWTLHAQAMVDLLRLVDHNTLSRSKLGLFLMSAGAAQDISAFCVGKSQLSQRAWLSWMAHRASSKGGGAFTAFEALCGYPEPLITIIARAAEVAENNTFHLLRDQARAAVTNLGPKYDSTPFSNRAETRRVEVEAALTNWKFPTLPGKTAPLIALALRTAWETIRTAAFIFIWRDCGFHANLLEPLPQHQGSLVELYIDQVISNVKLIVGMARLHEIRIGNAMLWPLVVVACECDPSSAIRTEELMDLLGSLSQIFSIAHFQSVQQVIQRLWAEKKVLSMQEQTRDGGRAMLSLEAVVENMGLVIPLL